VSNAVDSEKGDTVLISKRKISPITAATIKKGVSGIHKRREVSARP
jgi:hypothetical protein